MDGGKQDARVGGFAGDAEQAGFLVQQLAETLGCEAAGFKQGKDDAGIERSATRAHHQAIEG